MEKIPISDSELEVMKVLWDKAPRTLPQVVEAVRRVNPWESVTVKTLLNRLVRKQAVRQEGERRSYLYSPEITQEEYRREASSRFLASAFGGKTAALFSFFVKERGLSPAELAELKQMIEEAEQHE